MILACLLIALHDVDGPLYCATGERVRLSGIGALELDGRARPGQPSVPGDPYTQRRAMVAAIGGEVGFDDRRPGGRLWLARPLQLACTVDGRSYSRVTARCRLPDGRDVACIAIAAGVALRWPKYDADRRLVGCAR